MDDTFLPLSLKRSFDILFSLAALLTLLPLMLLLAFLVKWSSKGPIFFSQERLGRGGKPFRCYKFRSMYVDASQKLATLLESHEEYQREWEQKQKLRHDPRVTPLGQFLRKSCLDELPQFWNVLKGDLSIVGPRPVVQEELQRHFTPEQANKILSVRPGLTGLWQTSGRNDLSYQERLFLEESYVDSHTLWLDLWLIAKTIPCMLSQRGAY